MATRENFQRAHMIRIPLHSFVRALLLAAVMVTGSARAAENIRLACVGDSITAGYTLRDKARDAYPSQLSRLLGPDWTVRNFGVSGATLMPGGDLPYDRQPALAAALAWKPEIVVIALGTNDSKEINIGRHPGDFEPGYHDLIAKFRQANPQAKIFVCLPPPAFADVMNIRADILRNDIVPRIRKVAAEEKLPIIDLEQPLRSEAGHFPDKIHPDPEGAAKIARIVYGEVMRDTQPGAKSLDPAVNTALLPVPVLERNSYNWWTRHAEALDAGPRIQPDIVLLGDSITHFWGGEPRAGSANGPLAWKNTFDTRPVLNLGFGWDRTQNLLWRIDHGELDGLRPKLVILNIGTNNLSATNNARANTPQEIVEAIAVIRERVRQKCPGAHLIVMGVFPRGPQPNNPFRAPIAAINALLAKRLAGLPDTTFLDIDSRFLAPDGSLPHDKMPDGTHPSEAGYAIWGRALTESGLIPPPLPANR